MDDFAVRLSSGKLASIVYKGKVTELNKLAGTPVWDKINDIITLADSVRQLRHEGFNSVVHDYEYHSFCYECKKKLGVIKEQRN